MRRLVPLLLVLAACSPELGKPCGPDRPCPSGLTCWVPSGAAAGICDYPLRTEGETCTQAAECAAGLTCSNHFTPGQRYGACEPARPDGSACFASRDCQSGRCAGASGTALDGTCAPRS